jgi:hypothetical protein
VSVRAGLKSGAPWNSTGARPSNGSEVFTSWEHAGHIVGTLASFGAWFTPSWRATSASETSVTTNQTVSPATVPLCNGRVAYSKVRSMRRALVMVWRSGSSVSPTGALWSKPAGPVT